MESSSPSLVLTLDATNFEETINQAHLHRCRILHTMYEAAAATLSKHDPPIALAKVDVDDQANKAIASKYNVVGYPTIKILKNGGKVHHCNGPREANAIVEYIKRQVGPASSEIKSSDHSSIDLKRIHIVGVFPKFSGEEYDNFMVVAEKLRSNYDFSHTLDAKFLPRGQPVVKGPIVRLLKPFDELFVDFQDFNLDALEMFIVKAGTPLVTILNFSDPSSLPFILKFKQNSNDKVMLLTYFSDDNFEHFKSQYNDVAKAYKEEKISFSIADLAYCPGALEFYGLKEDQAPVIIVDTYNDGKRYLKTNLHPPEIAVWFKEYMDGKTAPYRQSQPIPEVNDELVKVTVCDNLPEVVMKSGKNVLIEFYAPKCGHYHQKLAAILDKVAISFKEDPDVTIAKLDGTANDVPKHFKVDSFPTIYFTSASGKLLKYEGNKKEEDIVDFIQANRDTMDKDGKVTSYGQSQPIPKVKEESVEVIVGDNNLTEAVPKSGKNVLIEFYGPWGGYCHQKLSNILDEVVVSFKEERDVIIVKLDATTNDFPKYFKVDSLPTLYFTSAGGKLLKYHGNMIKDVIVEFIRANRG